MNPFDIKETYELLSFAELIKPPSNYLTDKFFPNKELSLSDVVAVEYIKNHRRLAPFVTKRSRALNVARESSQVQLYKVPTIGAKRVIGLDEISRRIPGEQPVFSNKTAQDRADEMQGRDLRDLLNMLQNTREAMAAELLQTGKVTINSFSEDGAVVDTDVINFNKPPVTKNWTANTATIFDDLKDASETIQENSGVIPTLMVIGKNVEKYLLKNKDLREFLFSANPAATAFYNFQPRYDSPQARRIGFIPQLNLEVYSYFVTYMDETGQVKPFVDDDAVILGVPGRGKFLFGALRLLDQSGNWQTYSAEDIPIYNFNHEAQSTSLTVYSCCLPVPDVIDDWICLSVGN